jgi:hypothetical protein
MDWKNFFKLIVFKEEPAGIRPYFMSHLIVCDSIPLECLLIEKFNRLRLTSSEKKLFSMDHRKIIHSHHYFKGLEFKRIFENFRTKIISDNDSHLHFFTQAGGVYLFIELMKDRDPQLKNKKIICETTEIPLPLLRIPLRSTIEFRLIHNPSVQNWFGAFPSLWAKSEIIRLFDHKNKETVA